MKLELIPIAKQIRADLLSVEADIRVLSKSHDMPTDQRQSEVRANIMLAVRHVEDARMRLGKVIQHAEGRPSIYDAQPPASAGEQHPAENESGFRGVDLVPH